MARVRKDGELWYSICNTCHTAIAIGNRKSAGAMWCSPKCLAAQELRSRPDRESEWDALAAHGRTPCAIARMYGLPHAGVYKTLARVRVEAPPVWGKGRKA